MRYALCAIINFSHFLSIPANLYKSNVLSRTGSLLQSMVVARTCDTATYNLDSVYAGGLVIMAECVEFKKLYNRTVHF